LNRRIYYDDVKLFGSQDTVVQIVNQLEDYWRTPCSNFNLLPAPKGLFAGPIAYITRLSDNPTNSTLDHVQNWGVNWVSIGQLDEDYIYKAENIVDTSRIHSLMTKIQIYPIKWVLVIEKETAFSERVQELNLQRREKSDEETYDNGIIVTVCRQPRRIPPRAVEFLAHRLTSLNLLMM
jgi:DNA topoisomerase VI subunit A